MLEVFARTGNTPRQLLPRAYENVMLQEYPNARLSLPVSLPPESAPSAEGVLPLRAADSPGAEGGTGPSPLSHCRHEGAAQPGPLTSTRCDAAWLVHFGPGCRVLGFPTRFIDSVAAKNHQCFAPSPAEISRAQGHMGDAKFSAIGLPL